ncbi:outer membrane beta-barrel family protein [Epilithonimonas zeae]|uniref:outer membrane beta-barrel family protein n=1 Tax=Epilithonimonas zeae TaxID=1416779 RepID=UPI00200F5AD5|nr:outer membrane beta-barrel family protein [Epilithonimonas zeae]
MRQYNVAYKPEGTRNLLSDTNSVYTSEKRKDAPDALGVNYSFDYKINEKQNIGFIYDFGNQHYNMDARGISRYETKSVADSTLITQQRQRWTTPTHTLNAYYDIKLDSIGKKLSFTGNYLNNSPEKINDFSTINTVNNNEAIIKNNSKMKYAIFSAQSDLTLPYKWLNIETGLKYTLLDNKSDVGYFDFDGTGYVLNPDNTNVFHYKEHNYAAYVSFQKDFGEKWSAKAGLRYEYTSLQGFTPNDESSKIEKQYGKIFPTAYISYKPNSNHSLTLNYSKRIDRPDFQSLNPFRWYTNPYMYYTGNPALQPSFNDNVELNYSYKGKLTFGLYNQYTQNKTSNIARFSNGIYSNLTENGYDQNRTGINIGYYNTFFKIWETSVNANGSYTKTKPTIPELEKLKVYSMSYSFYNTITLNENKTWFLMLNFWHSLPFTYANIKLKDQLEFSPGIKTSLFDKKLQVNFVISDVFKTLKNNGYSYNGNFRSEFNQYNDYRGFKLSLTYSFGNKKVKGVNKNIDFKEQSRAN